MLVLVLILWQALGFPEVEDPFPERIGLTLPMGAAGAGGVFGGILSVIGWPQRRERFISVGTFIGFSIGLGVYVLSLAVQLLSSP